MTGALTFSVLVPGVNVCEVVELLLLLLLVGAFLSSAEPVATDANADMNPPNFFAAPPKLSLPKIILELEC